MIKGALNTYDHRFGDNVNNFIKMVSFISIEYKTVKVKSAESINKTLFFEINGYKSAKRFGEGLAKSYDQAIDEIEETLLIDFRKEDRLTYISNLSLKFSEVKPLLSNDSKIGYKHKNLIFPNVIRAKKNKEEPNDESLYQEYYTLLDQYLKKIILYLKNKRKLHNKLNDSEISLHKINVPDEDESTKESPLKFFKYLITKSGVSSLLQQFKPSKDDFSRNDIDYDDVSYTITYNHYDVENGKHFEKTLTFNDYLLKLLKIESIKSERLISNQFNALKNEPQTTFFLTRILNDLKTLAKNVESEKDALGYADIKKVIDVLINHFNTNYAVLITPGKTKKDNTYFFQLIGKAASIHEKAKNLHSSLVKNEFLEKGSKKAFIKLFTGQQPIDKITWVGDINQLKLFINLLMSKEKIKKFTRGKWQIVAANFKSNDANFSAEQLKDAKSPTNKTKIENIVYKISC